ncbi:MULTISPECIES: hypothetical protein [Pseudoalteromonas]|jgi:DNA-binding transcriptional MerR regulator|uniref:hypothetical protein n=1 Tax=Pseudoalteromonas TaxID=53246 RepID=UPI0021BD48E0|nr:hypothetical protein [Pseudoalteromonas neustonica]
MKAIGKLAQDLNINSFCEHQGMIEQPLKSEFGYRVYADALANQLNFILKLNN